MGVDITTHLIFGFKGHPKDLKQHNINIWNDKFLPYTEGHEGIIDTLVKDDADTYFIFGRSLSALDWEDGKIHTIQYQHIGLIEETKRLKKLFIQLFGQDVWDSIDNKEPQLMAFNHYH
jgi:hypothetical protein